MGAVCCAPPSDVQAENKSMLSQKPTRNNPLEGAGGMQEPEGEKVVVPEVSVKNAQADAAKKEEDQAPKED